MNEIQDLTEVILQTARRGCEPPLRNPKVDYDSVEATVTKFNYKNTDPRKGAPTALKEVDYTNGTSVEQLVGFKHEVETTATIGLSVTAGFRYKQEVKANLKLKEFLEVGGGQEWEISLSATLSAEKSFTQRWGWDFPLRVPAKRRIVAKALLANLYIEPEFTAEIDIVAGHAVCVYEDVPGGGGGVIRIGGSLASWVFPANHPAPPRFSRTASENVVKYQAAGRLTGTYGQRVDIFVSEYTLEGDLVSSGLFELAEDGNLKLIRESSGEVPTLAQPEEVMVAEAVR